MKVHLATLNSFGKVCALTLLASCSGTGATSDFEVDTIAQDINNGVLVSSNVAPYNSVVRLFPLEDDPVSCTATKLGASRYLTAAHCLQGDNFDFVGPGDTMDISSALNAIGVGTEVTVTAVYYHPSYRQDWDGAGDTVASEHSYDVALFDIQGTGGPGVQLGFEAGHIGDGLAVRQVGYGGDNFNPSNGLSKQTATYTTASQQTTGASAARYAHQISTYETGNNRQSANGGDSGGPLLYQTSAGAWRVVGVSVSTNGESGTPDPAISGYARVANVGRWLNAPHNGNAPFNGIGFVQSVGFRQCMRTQSSTPGTRARLAECEGYDPDLHATLWELVPSGTYYQIRMGKSSLNRCLGIITNTNDVAVFQCDTVSAQQWSIATFPGNSSLLTIKNRLRNMYLTSIVSGGNLSVSNNSEATWLWYR